MRAKTLSKWVSTIAPSLCLGVILSAGVCAAAESNSISVKNGDVIAFLGDSITAFGFGSPSGYGRLVMNAFEKNGIKVKAIEAGRGGDKSNQMLARLSKVIDGKPTWLLVSCGVNDVSWGDKGVPLDQYKQNMAEIVSRAQSSGIKVMILTATVIGEDLDNAKNQTLAGYNGYLRELAGQKKCLIADLGAQMQNAIRKAAAQSMTNGALFTVDGVHMNPHGNILMASGILSAFGFDETRIKTLQAEWLDVPKACTITVKSDVSIREYQKLEEAARGGNANIQKFLDAKFRQDIDELLKQ